MVILQLIIIWFAITSKNPIGAEAIYRDNFVILNGQFSIPAESVEYINIDYPQGYNRNNCVVVSCSIDGNSMGNNFVGYYEDSGDIMRCAFKRTLTFYDNYIYFQVDNPFTEQSLNVKYKIVIMKLPEVSVNGFEAGDVNMDGEITLEDAELVKGYLMDTKALTDKQFKLADMNQNGEVNSSDYQTIKNLAEE